MRLTTLHSTEAHEEGIWSSTWIPGTSRLLTGSVDESVKVWEDTPEGQLKFVHTYQGHTLGVVSVATDASGEYAASSALDSYVRVWRLSDHTTAAMIEAATTETWSVAFSPINTELLLAVAGGTRGAVVLWGIDKGDTAAFKTELQLPPVRAHGLHGAWDRAWACMACMVRVAHTRTHAHTPMRARHRRQRTAAARGASASC
jgi:WD40 repeat protein